MGDQAERPRNPNGTFQVGQPRPEIPRRAKSVPNKLTTLDIRNGILEAANRVGSDGRGTGGWVGYLESVARKHPKYFLPLFGRVVTLDINESHESEGPESTGAKLSIERVRCVSLRIKPIEQTEKPVEAVKEPLGAPDLRLVRSPRK